MIIGIIGKAGSGKDTVADYLVSKYGFTKVSFASILKDMLSVAGLPEPSNRDDKEKVVGGFDFTWRHAAQTLGTEWGRNCLDKDIWVKLTMKNLGDGINYVFSDVRFDNEAKAIKEAGGFNIKLIGREVELGESGTHPSEAGVSEELISQVINNDSSLQDLYLKVNSTISVHLMVKHDG